MRLSTSLAEPGENGTIIRIGREGHLSWACTPAAITPGASAAHASAARTSRRNECMMVPPRCFVILTALLQRRKIRGIHVYRNSLLHDRTARFRCRFRLHPLGVAAKRVPIFLRGFAARMGEDVNERIRRER